MRRNLSGREPMGHLGSEAQYLRHGRALELANTRSSFSWSQKETACGIPPKWNPIHDGLLRCHSQFSFPSPDNCTRNAFGLASDIADHSEGGPLQTLSRTPRAVSDSPVPHWAKSIAVPYRISCPKILVHVIISSSRTVSFDFLAYSGVRPYFHNHRPRFDADERPAVSQKLRWSGETVSNTACCLGQLLSGVSTSVIHNRRLVSHFGSR